MALPFFTFDEVNHWFEINAKGTAYRQVIQRMWDNGQWENSSVSFTLAEQPVEIDEDTQIISKASFEEVWSAFIEPYQPMFAEAKALYPIGTKVEGVVKRFFPQGTLVTVDSATGLIVDQWSKANGHSLVVGSKLPLVVTGYDEQNLWLLTSLE